MVLDDDDDDLQEKEGAEAYKHFEGCVELVLQGSR